MERNLSQQRCFNHAGREAAAQCPECRRYYCRECVTEHDDRVLCAACLARLTSGKSERRAHFASVGRAFLCAAGVLTLWLFFYFMGRGLLILPSAFHEGSLWQAGYWERR